MSNAKVQVSNQFQKPNSRILEFDIPLIFGFWHLNFWDKSTGLGKKWI